MKLIIKKKIYILMCLINLKINMAVFTKLNRKEIEEFIYFYNIGKLEHYEEIIEGIENTNYKIFCEGKPYVLTIFEKRVK